jgi:predicted ATPase
VAVPIRTPDQRVRVFVSSTLQELAEERAAARAAIQHMRLSPILFEMGARAHAPRDLYRAYLAQSDVFVGIYWQRYGWIAPGEEISGLEDEYVLARDIPKLVYVKRAETREERLAQLIGRMQAEDQVSYRPFSSAEELEDLLENDLASLLTERFAQAVPSEDTDASADAPPAWLAPLERGELLGRAETVAGITELLGRANVGLVTLTGPGGTGKTRLAVHVAHTLAGSFPDGVFYVPLAAVANARDVVPAIVSTLEIPGPRSDGEPEKRLLGFLRARRALLVLDNFEHVLEAAGIVPRLLGACAHLKVLVTSREALHVRGEHEAHVPPLPHDPRAERSPAMTLFEERAREVRPDFRLDAGNRAAVAELCRRLDALPLAIELAAARVRMLSPQVMLARLGASLSLLSGGRHDLPERHRALRNTIEWSLDLLRPEEQIFFRRLGVFAGTFCEEAAAAVVADAGLESLEGLTSLVDKSLLVRTEVREEARFHMLETVREMAIERLRAAGEERAARIRQAEWLERVLAREQENLLKSGLRQPAHHRIVAEMSSARPVLRFVAGPDGDTELAWRLYVLLAVSLLNNAQTAEALAMREIVSVLPPSQDPLRAALADGVVGRVVAYTWDPSAEPLLARAQEALEAADDSDFLPSIVTVRGMIAGHLDPDRGLALLGRAVELSRKWGHTYTEGWARGMIVYTLLMAGRLDEAGRSAHEAAEVARAQHSDEGLAFALIGLAYVTLRQGGLPEARANLAEAAVLARTRDAAWPCCMALIGLCSVTLAEGDQAGAGALLDEALHYLSGAGFIAIDALCGAIALRLAQAGERERALKVFAGVRAGAEGETGINAYMADPTGSLRQATRDARRLLGNPAAVEVDALDFSSVVQAALGTSQRPGP